VRTPFANHPVVRVFALLALIILGGPLRAVDLPPSVTLDLPVPANQATPSWLGHPETPPTEFATLNLPILTPNADASLLVTVYFQEKQGGFMRVLWKGTQGAQVLSDNFYENIGMANQRSLLVSPTTLVGDGTLIFQCGDTALGIQRIKLEWLQKSTALTSPDVHGLIVAPSVGPAQSSSVLNGQPVLDQPAAWQGDIVTVPLTDSALRIEEGVEFSVDLDKVPGSARLAFKEAGLALGKRIVVWINQQRAGTVTPAVPDLLDKGFLTDAATTTTTYSGWRDGTFSVPISMLKDGVNTVQLSDESDVTLTSSSSLSSDATETPLAVKGMLMQLNYVATTASAPSTNAAAVSPSDSTDSSTPTGPISPGASFLTTPPQLSNP
jgi:hypothetical protein